MPVKLNSGQGAKPIVLDEIKIMIAHYRASMNPGDAKSGWISKDEILALLEDNEGTGIRVYYGRHDTKDQKYPDMHNLIFVATKSSDPSVAPQWYNTVDQLDESLNSVSFNTRVGEYDGMGAESIPLCPSNCPTAPTL
ncbi:hypothetical protein WG904_19010 [Pedobacter sp. Du54]|uniref:hypothetical protein n=1 Tax=Pedobacter anseongensis TaxID=3133439 RepID=UPI0030B21CEF